MKLFKKISIFASSTLAMSLIFSVGAFATEITKDTRPETFYERLELALQGTITGILMVFAVLALLTLILYISKVFLYDIPEKKRSKAKAKKEEYFENVANTVPAVEEAPVEETDDTELAAVITAAIAAMLEDEEYAEEFRGGFRVVSFKRSEKPTSWNKK